MAHTTNIVVNGTSYPVIEFDHTAQEIDDSVEKTVTMVRPNLLDNWYFVGGGSQQGGGQFPINQRGETSYLLSDYSIDRWRLASPGETLTLNADGIHISFDSGSSRIFWQLFEKAFIQAGKIYTFSVLIGNVTGNVYISTSFYNTVIGASSNDIKVTANSVTSFTFITKDEIPNNPSVYIWGSGSEVDIIAAKLELGPTQTLAYQDEDGNWVLNETPNFQEQLARCQRYAISLNPYKYGSRTVGSGISTSTTSCYVFCPTPVPVRTTPSITRSGSWRLVGSNTRTVSNITVNSFAGNGVKLLVTSSGLIDGETYFLESSANSSDILLRADL